MSVTVRALAETDHEAWLPLWHGYLEYYRTVLRSEVTEATFARLVAGQEMRGGIAHDSDGRAVGMVTWLWHPGTWSERENVYLEDLFVAPDVRGGGIGRALIEHVTAGARARGAAKVYWHTQRSNETARRLYDAIATDTGYMHYEITL